MAGFHAVRESSGFGGFPLTAGWAEIPHLPRSRFSGFRAVRNFRRLGEIHETLGSAEIPHFAESQKSDFKGCGNSAAAKRVLISELCQHGGAPHGIRISCVRGGAAGGFCPLFISLSVQAAARPESTLLRRPTQILQSQFQNVSVARK